MGASSFECAQVAVPHHARLGCAHISTMAGQVTSKTAMCASWSKARHRNTCVLVWIVILRWRHDRHIKCNFS